MRETQRVDWKQVVVVVMVPFFPQVRRPDQDSRRGRRARTAHGEAGYILLGVLILVALFAMVLAIAAPIVAKDIERDKEVEAVHRGTQYKRAIKLYYKRFGSYPVSIKQLEETNNIRFLRKRYLDPITGKDDWRLIHVGEAKVPVMGFFGQPLQGGMSSVTTGLNGNGTGGLGTPAGSAGNSGSSLGGSLFNNSGSGNTGSGSASGSSSGTGDVSAGGGSGAPAGVLPGMGSSGGAATGSNGTTGTPIGGTGTSGGLGGTGFNGSTTTGSGGSGFDGGGPIVGVGLPKDKKSIVVYKKQASFNKWEFTYDPIEDQQTMSSSSIPGASAANTSIGGGTTTNGGFGSTGSSFGSSGSTFGSGFSNSNSGSSSSGASNSSGSGSSNSSGNSGSGNGSSNGSGDGSSTPTPPPN